MREELLDDAVDQLPAVAVEIMQGALTKRGMKKLAERLKAEAEAAQAAQVATGTNGAGGMVPPSVAAQGSPLT